MLIKDLITNLTQLKEHTLYHRNVPLFNEGLEKLGNYIYITSIQPLPNNPGADLNQKVVFFDVYDNDFQFIKSEGFQMAIFETFIDKKQMHHIEFDNEGEEAKWLMMRS